MGPWMFYNFPYLCLLILFLEWACVIYLPAIATIILQKRSVPKLIRLIKQGFILTLTGQQVNCNLADGDGFGRAALSQAAGHLGLLLTAGWIEDCSTCPHFGTLA